VRRSLTALAATALLALAACSGSTATSAPTAAPAATAAPASSVAAPGGGQAVAIKNFSFNPATVTAKVGESITWTNGDDAPHTVTFDDSSVGGSGSLNNGTSFSLAIAKAGTYTYHCKIHQSMKGTVTIS
jgi:plastocyanin